MPPAYNHMIFCSLHRSTTYKMLLHNITSTLLLILFITHHSVATHSEQVSFFQCFSSHSQRDHSNQTSNVVLTSNSSDYSFILQSSIRNRRFLNTSTSKPEFIVTPTHTSHIQSAIICSRKHGFQIRVRSGGHDYEGQSYVANVPFVVIDLYNLRSIDVNIENGFAWVETGAIIGELYYKIAEKSNLYGFPAGLCPTVGVGGHISGGGIGTMIRKYGLSADNIIDAKMVDVNGKVLTRESMGEDLFWAIRGGGGASFGVIVSWKIRLVAVPQRVTIFPSVSYRMELGGTKLLHKWQTVAHKLHEDVFLQAVVSVSNSSSVNNTIFRVSFAGLSFLGPEKLASLMQDSFPELGLKPQNCREMTWIQSVLYFAGFSEKESPEVLLNRTTKSERFFKAKSDYVVEPIPETMLERVYKILIEKNTSVLFLTPLGGRMSEISESEIPYPHRKGYLYEIQYFVTWDHDDETDKYIDWMRRLYHYMTPYVSNNPRAAYLNYRDLDLGKNNNGSTSYDQAKVWGSKYFKNNFNRLVRVKTAVDPSNYFRNDQSIPVVQSLGKKY